jgi:hypothetical protein
MPFATVRQRVGCLTLELSSDALLPRGSCNDARAPARSAWRAGICALRVCDEVIETKYSGKLTPSLVAKLTRGYSASGTAGQWRVV